ncbi:hypothetical protein [uncultured Chryseobacterium sp.]|uniref:hypothetical protein n=1 Tax=uncultured Chryseobacterium sp. TaxID=259322 RepID=UPI0025EA7021|nr:hypothetical protein [uncultured Chryseobacterium sp.]
MKQIIFSFLSIFMISSCTLNKKELVGKYSLNGKQINDSLILTNDKYIHKIFDKNYKLMYIGSNKWTLYNDKITLFGFYSNENNLIDEPLSDEDVKKFLMITSFPVYKQNNEMILEVNADENIFYRKLLDND